MKEKESDLFFNQIRKNVAEDEDSWPTDRAIAVHYFNHFPKVFERLQDYSRGIRQSGERFIHVDLGGRAHFSPYWDDEIFADKSYSFSLSDKGLEERPFVEYAEGDLLNSSDFDAFIESLKEKEKAVHLVTMETIGGLMIHDPEWIMHNKAVSLETIESIYTKMLYRRFKKLSEVLETGGFVFLGFNSFLCDYIRDNKDYFDEFFDKLGFTFQEMDEQTEHSSPRFLLKKVR